MTAQPIRIKIIPAEKGPAGKLADAELHFPVIDDAARAGLQSTLAVAYGQQQHEAKAIQHAIALALALDGAKLIGFAIWERRAGTGRNVTFPARQYSINGERRSFALLRPTEHTNDTQSRIRDLILHAYADHERAACATATTDTPPAAAASTETIDVPIAPPPEPASVAPALALF